MWHGTRTKLSHSSHNSHALTPPPPFATRFARRSSEKKNKLLIGDLKNLKEDFWSSTKDMADLKADVEEKVQNAVQRTNVKSAKKKQQDGLVKVMMEDLMHLQEDVEHTLNSKQDEDAADHDELEVLKKDIQDALAQVKANPHSDDSLKTVTRLSIHMQNVLAADDLKRMQIENKGEGSGGVLDEGDDGFEEEVFSEEEEEEVETSQGDTEGAAADGEGDGEPKMLRRRSTKKRKQSARSGGGEESTPQFRRTRSHTLCDVKVVMTPQAKSRRSSLVAEVDPEILKDIQEPKDGPGDPSKEDNLRSRLEGTGKRLAELMSAFSNVGKLELAVRKLQEDMVTQAKGVKAIVKQTSGVKTLVETKASKVEVDSITSSKADLEMVQGIIASLQEKQEELFIRSDPKNIAKALESHNIGSSAVDELGANLSKTLMSIEGLKKDITSKANGADVSTAIMGLQGSMKILVAESLKKDELSTVLQNKVDKKDLKKLASALQGLDGPASLTAGATRCLICERPGFVEQKEAISASMSSSVDELDGRDLRSAGSFETQRSSYSLPDVTPPRGGRRGSGGSLGPETEDNINRVREEELVGAQSVNRHPRIMPPSNRMRVSAGGGMRVSSGGAGGSGRRGR